MNSHGHCCTPPIDRTARLKIASQAKEIASLKRANRRMAARLRKLEARPVSAYRYRTIGGGDP
jgi:hypothetical protein